MTGVELPDPGIRHERAGDCPTWPGLCWCDHRCADVSPCGHPSHSRDEPGNGPQRPAEPRTGEPTGERVPGTGTEALRAVARYTDRLWHTSQHSRCLIWLAGRIQDDVNALRAAVGLSEFGWNYWVPDEEAGRCAVHTEDECAGQHTHNPPVRGRVESRCVNDTDGDGDCAACARNPQALCRQPQLAAAWVDSTCCDGTGYADYAAVRCPAPDCPVPEAQWRAVTVVTPEQAHALDPTHEWHPGHGCPVCAREAAERRYGHLTSHERLSLAAHARSLAETWRDAPKRYRRWRAVADELYPDIVEKRP